MHNANRSQNICSTSKYYHTKFQIIPFSRLATLGLQMYFGGSVHVCTSMKIIMHNANRSQNICSTSKYYHTKFQIIPFSRLATLGLQMHFGGLCTYARI